MADIIMRNKEIIDKAVKTFDITDKCYLTTFILPDGKKLSGEGYEIGFNRISHHDVAVAIFKDLSEIQYPEGELIMKTGMVRYFPQFNRHYIEFSEKFGLTKEQLETLEECICFHNPDALKRVEYDVWDKGAFIESDNISEGLEGIDSCFDIIKKLKKKFLIKEKI